MRINLSIKFNIFITDKVNNYKHYRLDIIFKAAAQGGEFTCNKSYINTKIFKSDIVEHKVLEVIEVYRYFIT